MLEDREYMKRRPSGAGSGENPANGIRALFALIVVNVLAYLLFPGDAKQSLILFPPSFAEGKIYQVVTAIFMHASFFHLFFNMFALYVFGSIAAPSLGVRRFLSLYFATGIAGNLVWLAANWNQPVAILGASGAVMGVIMATAMMNPNIEMLMLFIPFPIKLRTMAIVFIAIDVLGEITSNAPGIAYLAHIGGFAAGYLFMVLFLRNYVQWDPLAALFRGRGNSAPRESRRMPDGWTMSGNSDSRRNPDPTPASGPVTQRELDGLLDKISRQGINALSEAEMERLRQAREQMRGSGR